jgi:uncharacterized protein YerC
MTGTGICNKNILTNPLTIFIMSYQNYEKHLNIINVLGEQKVNELYRFLGAEKISMATLKKVIEKTRIAGSLFENKPITRIATEHGVSRMTIYRQIKKSNRNEKVVTTV